VADEAKKIEPGEQERARAVFYAQELIIPLLQADSGELSALVKEFSQRNYEIPFSRRGSISERTLWRLLSLYQTEGLDGLCRKPRSDAGRLRVLPAHILKRAIEIRQDLPSRSVRRILSILKKEFPLEIGLVKKSTLSHALATAGCSRVRRRKVKPSPQKDRYIKMRWALPLQLAQSDVCGETLYVTENAQICKASLMGVLDHCTKLCLHAEWFLAADLPALERCVVQALLRYGVFELLHVDHGKIYESYLCNNICSEVGAAVKYTRPGYAPGKGGIERFWLTVEDDFIPEVGDSTRFNLAQLNEKFKAWLHEYNHTIHSATGEAPIERYQRLVGEVRFPDPVRLFRASLLRETRTVDKRFCTVRVRNQSFAVHPSLRAKKVQVRFDPFTLTEVYVYDLTGRRALQIAKPVPPDEKPGPFLPEEPAHKTPSIDALGLLEADHAEHLAAQRSQALPSAPRQGGRFAHFCQIVGQILKRENWTGFELSTLREYWEQYGPFKAAAVRKTLEPMAERSGSDLHLDEYLRSLVEAQLQQEGEENAP
jgi:hypothetical protein